MRITHPAWTFASARLGDKVVKDLAREPREPGRARPGVGTAVDRAGAKSFQENHATWAAEHRIGSMLSSQLYVSGDNLGALNLYNRLTGCVQRRV